MRQVPSPAPPAANSTLLAPPPSPARCDVHKCPWWPYSSSKDFRANMALVVVFLFCALICGFAFNCAIRYLCMRRRRMLGAPESLKAELGCTAAAQEAGAPALVYWEGMKLAGAAAVAECAICLSEFAVGERIRVLEKCSHGFHVQCIEKWLVSHSSCPTCRANSH